MEIPPLTRAEGFPCHGHLLSGEPVTGLLILSYSRQKIDGFPHPVGAGMTRRCQLKIEGVVPDRPLPFTALVVSARLGERLQIDVTPETWTAGEGVWHCQGPYELWQRWKLSQEKQWLVDEDGTRA